MDERAMAEISRYSPHNNVSRENGQREKSEMISPKFGLPESQLSMATKEFLSGNRIYENPASKNIVKSSSAGRQRGPLDQLQNLNYYQN